MVGPAKAETPHMRLTQYTDYSIRVLIYLGLQGEKLSRIQEISDAYAVSRNHLMKVVQNLVTAGYVESRRGKGGGIRLALPPEEIPLGSVVRDMEPDFGLVECLRPGNCCVITPSCNLPFALNQAMAAFLKELDRFTLADVLTPDQVPALILQLRLAPEPAAPARFG